jgi:hypothetical protein
MLKSNIKIGQKVTYNSTYMTDKGIVKTLSNDGCVFVVYHCDNDWENYKDYTAAKTRIDDLEIGWRE